MTIFVSDGRGLLCTVMIEYDTNGSFIAQIHEIDRYRDIQESLGLAARAHLKGFGPTIQIAFDNLRAQLAL